VSAPETREPEAWRPVLGFEGAYSVSDLGRVRSEARVIMRRNGCPQTIHERILRHATNEHGYHEVNLQVGGKARTRLVHHLVLEAFVGPRPPGLICCHNDSNSSNQRATNLRWDTYSSNAHDAVAVGSMPRGEKAFGAKLTADQVRAIRADRRPQAEIARAFGVETSNISRIKTRDTWAHL